MAGRPWVHQMFGIYSLMWALNLPTQSARTGEFSWGQPGGNQGAAHVPSQNRVSDGTRTRDICDHNAALYQLSYTHRDSLSGALEESTMPSTRR